MAGENQSAKEFADLLRGAVFGRVKGRRVEIHGRDRALISFARNVSTEANPVTSEEVQEWYNGTALPRDIEPVLRAAFGPAGGPENTIREAMRRAYIRAQAQLALPAIAAARDAAAPGWVLDPATGMFVPDPQPAQSDIEAAARHDVAQRHASVLHKQRVLVNTLGDRLLNAQEWAGLATIAATFGSDIERPTADLPGNLSKIYDGIVSLAHFVEQDNAIRADSGSMFDPLPPDIRRALADLITTAAPWVRSFPSARGWDDEAGSFLTRRELFVPVRRFLAVAREEGQIESATEASVTAMLPVAEAGDFQGQKAGNRAVGLTRNLIFAGLIYIGGIYSGATGNALSGDSKIVKAAVRTFLRAEDAVCDLVAGLPAHLRVAVQGMLDANRADQGIAINSMPELPAVRTEPQPPVWPPRSHLARWREIRGSPPPWCPEMITLAPPDPFNRFLMGAPRSEQMSDDNERPQRLVTVSAFALGRFAICFDEWDAARDAGSNLPKLDDGGFGRRGRPVINVSWVEAKAYCNWLNTILGLERDTYRLPTEAEWEFACRAGTPTPFSFGTTVDWRQVNYNASFTYGQGKKGQYRQRTVSVGSLPANDWGFHEMHGNVAEWVEDLHGPYPDLPIPSSAAELIQKDLGLRCIRGGSWRDKPNSVRSAQRGRSDWRGRNFALGFRVARSLPQ